MSDKARKTVKVISPKHDDRWEINVYATEDPLYPEFYNVTINGYVISIGSDVDQYIEVFTKIKKQLEKAGK